jgi:hypothetical protein
MELCFEALCNNSNTLNLVYEGFSNFAMILFLKSHVIETVLTYDLFNDAVSSSDCIALNARKISE